MGACSSSIAVERKSLFKRKRCNASRLKTALDDQLGSLIKKSNICPTKEVDYQRPRSQTDSTTNSDDYEGLTLDLIRVSKATEAKIFTYSHANGLSTHLAYDLNSLKSWEVS